MEGLDFMFVFLIALCLTLTGILLYDRLKQKDREIATLQKEREALRQELDNLIERKRQTGPTIAGLEDMALQLTNLKLNRQIEDVIIDACLNTAGQLRQGPYNYDPNKASGNREAFK